MELKQLRPDKDHTILTTDQGVTLVVMDRQDYIKKARNLLEDTTTHRPIQTDATNEYKAKLINLLKNIKPETGMNDNIYRKMYPTGTSSPKFYGIPKIHKKNIPLRPIVSSIGSLTHERAKELARILKTFHHINNTKEFADEVRNTKMEDGECIASYVTALFTAVPVSYSLDIIKNRLEQNKDLPNRSIMSAYNIIELLGFYLNNTYFPFQDQFFEQTKGAAMGPSASPIVANIFMEAFENRAFTTALNSPQGYGRGMLMTPL